jgi:adenylate cyclase class 2
MAIEIEKKYSLTADETTNIIFMLDELNANFTGEAFEENIIYTGGFLRERQAVLRLRNVGGKTILTYKERVPTATDIKHQIEHETAVENFEAASKIIEALGFTRSLVYEKLRRTWKIEDAEIVLDKLPFGLYMEIEGSVDSIKKVEKLLEIEDLPAMHETYPQLTVKFGQTAGQTIEARFEKEG